MKNSEFKIEELQIKEAVPSDFKEVSELLFESAMLHHQGEPNIFREPKENDPTIKEDFIELIKDKETKYLIAAYKGSVIGLISISIKSRKKSPHTYSGEVANIGELVVKKDFRHKGIGKILVNKAIDLINSQKKTEEITLHVRSFNKNAISFYENLGFQSKVHIMSKKNKD